MRWTVHSEKSLYTDPWIDLRVAEVELPGGRRIAHRLLRRPPGAGAVVCDDRDRVLLLWRHRFVPDTWGYEIPMGGIAPGESAVQAAARETEEETGWRPGPLRPLLYTQPSSGLTDSEHHVFLADSAEHVGAPTDHWESERITWLPLARVPDLIGERTLVSGTSMNALLYLYATRARPRGPAGGRGVSR